MLVSHVNQKFKQNFPKKINIIYKIFFNNKKNKKSLIILKIIENINLLIGNISFEFIY